MIAVEPATTGRAPPHQKYVKVEDAYGGEAGRIYVCPRCGGLVLGFGYSKIGEREHKHCPPDPRLPDPADMEVCEE